MKVALQWLAQVLRSPLPPWPGDDAPWWQRILWALAGGFEERAP